jgi:4-diphosphocytidyl-2-C-methyl-D-erythritol kinase
MITTYAPAKINLDLRVIGKRRDGFHELRTLLHSIELHDTLSFRYCAGPITVRSNTVGIPKDRKNIVWRAASELWTALGRRGLPKDVAISITKSIPVGAGLGGGSSDAASALRGLCVLWEANLGRACLRKVAARVGSDVPFFLDGGVALASGRGERVRQIGTLNPLWVVLAIPSFCVSTVNAYQWFDADKHKRPLVLSQTRLPRGWRHRMGTLFNDLQSVVVAKNPELSVVIDALVATDAELAAMTGSGSAVFGLFKNRASALTAHRAIRQSGWRILLNRTVDRSEFFRMTQVVGCQLVADMRSR